MTRDELESIPAGKELDALVAKRVMGVDEKLFNFAYEAGNYNYSTDISAAFEVLEKFPIATIHFIEIFEGYKQYRVEIPFKHGTVEYQCRDLPESACKAALIAMEASHETEA